jgi:XTP/dITP diphosphohydrolase
MTDTTRRRCPLYVVTSNAGKVQEIQAILGLLQNAPCGVSTPLYTVRRITDLVQPLPEIEEDGDTFEANALKKVMALPMVAEAIFLADDSGVCVSALGGRPGIYSARYPGQTSGEKCLNLLAELGDADDRRAYFYCAIAIRFSDGHAHVVSGRLDGTLAWDPRGDHGFGYDPIFIPEGETQTVAELSDVAKNLMSHRHRALAKILPLLAEREGVTHG